MENYLLIGKIGKPVGLKGFIHVNFINQNRGCLLDKPYVFIKCGESYKKFDIEGLRIDKPEIVKLSGIDDRTAGEKILGYELYLETDLSEKPDDNTFYLEDLIGAKVVSDGVERGLVSDVKNYGASDIIEIKFPDNKHVLVPYIEDVVKEINIEEKIIFIKNIDDYI